MPAHGECSQGLGTYSTVPVRTIIVLSLSYRYLRLRLEESHPSDKGGCIEPLTNSLGNLAWGCQSLGCQIPCDTG